MKYVTTLFNENQINQKYYQTNQKLKNAQGGWLYEKSVCKFRKVNDSFKPNLINVIKKNPETFRCLKSILSVHQTKKGPQQTKRL